MFVVDNIPLLAGLKLKCLWGACFFGRIKLEIFKGLKFYVSAKNPIVFSDWLGLDPENGGVLGQSNPVFKTINFGTTLTF